MRCRPRWRHLEREEHPDGASYRTKRKLSGNPVRLASQAENCHQVSAPEDGSSQANEVQHFRGYAQERVAAPFLNLELHVTSSFRRQLSVQPAADESRLSDINMKPNGDKEMTIARFRNRAIKRAPQ